MKCNKNQEAGLTLIELATVFLVIALIAASILIASSLKKSAEVRVIVSDLNRIQTAYNLFREKYRARPGDMVNATTHITSSTANGRGNQQINWGSYTNLDSITVNPGALAWQHLTLANFFPGSYSDASPINECEPGVNVPKSKSKKGGYYFNYTSVLTNHVIYGSETADGGGGSMQCHGAILSPFDIRDIDFKTDDGKPLTGLLRLYSNPSACVAVGDEYSLTDNSIECALIKIVD